MMGFGIKTSETAQGRQGAAKRWSRSIPRHKLKPREGIGAVMRIYMATMIACKDHGRTGHARNKSQEPTKPADKHQGRQRADTRGS